MRPRVPHGPEKGPEGAAGGSAHMVPAAQEPYATNEGKPPVSETTTPAPEGNGAACCGCKKFSSAAEAKFAVLDAFIDSLGLDPNDERRRGRLIQILHRAQHIFGYLPREVQQHVAEKMAIPESAVSGVVSFYNYFTTKPKGKHVINVCLGTACYVKGSEGVLRELERVLGIEADTTPTADGLFSLGSLRCVGACGLAPVMLVDDKVYGKITPAGAVKVVEEIKAKEAQA